MFWKRMMFGCIAASLLATPFTTGMASAGPAGVGERSNRVEIVDPVPASGFAKLVADLQSPQAMVRLIAAKKLGQLGGAARDAIPALSQILQDPDPDVRAVVANALRHIQEANVPGVPTAAAAGAQEINGRLTQDDPKDKYRKESYADIHEVVLQQGTTYRIDLVSSDFDPYLRVADANGVVKAADDDGGDGLNSRILFNPETSGKYQLTVTSFQGGRTGNYKLTVIAFSVSGQPKETPGQLTNQSPKNNMGQHYEVVKVRFEAGFNYIIDVISTEFDPVLVIRDDAGKTLAYDDDGGDGLNARLMFAPTESREYRLFVFSFRPQSLGRFTMRIQTLTPANNDVPPPPPPTGTLARLVVTRFTLAHGRVDNLRIPGLYNAANRSGEPVRGVEALIDAIGAQPNPMRITLDLDKTGLQPNNPDAPSPIVLAGANLLSGMSLVVCELGPGDTFRRWQWLVPRFGNGNYYATVSIPAAGIRAGQELVTKDHFDAYLANSIFYEAPDFGNVVVNHNIEGGISALTANVFNQKEFQVHTRLGWANPLELILSEAGQEHKKDEPVRITLQARLPMSFESDIVIRWAAQTQSKTIIRDTPVTAVQAGKSLFRIANFTMELPKDTKGMVSVSAVASARGLLRPTPPATIPLLVNPFVNPLPDEPQSIGLSTFHSRSSTLEDTLSVRVKDLEEEITEKLDDAKAKSGDVQVSLFWRSKDDLDLHVVAPSGETIYYGHRTSKCGGQLDVDMNVQYSKAVAGAVENIFWPSGKAPAGHYKVYVHYYRFHGSAGCSDPAPFTVRIVTRGRSQLFNGVVSYRDASHRKVLVHEFDLY